MRPNTAFAASVLLLVSCLPLPDNRPFPGGDVTPPVFEGIRALDRSRIELEFNEATNAREETLAIEPYIPVKGVLCAGPQVTIETGVQVPGNAYLISGCFEDAQGNSTALTHSFYGYNPEVPRILINEFITEGSKTHPDICELKVMRGGNMGGVAFYQGTPDNFSDRLVFPPFRVTQGDFILIHFKPEGIAAEVNETLDKTASGGLDSSGTAFDFWLKGSKGISGNNGVLSLYENPNGTILDGVLYSNRTSAPDDRYLGFGTKDTMERALRLVKDRGWAAKGDKVAPDDGINPEESTSTRSICRDGKGTDTDTARDFHIVPNRKSTFGGENSDEVYTPQESSTRRVPSGR